MFGGFNDVITDNKFDQNRSRGFRATGVRKLGSPIDLACRLYNSSALPCWLWFNCSKHCFQWGKSRENNRVSRLAFLK